MPVMDEFKEERETIKKATFKKKWEYFWEYYKWWVICGVFAIIIIITTVNSILTRKKDVLYIAVINGVEVAGNDLQDRVIDPFLTAHDYNIKKNNVRFDLDFKMNISSSNHVKANTLPDKLTDYVSITNSANARQNLSIYIASSTVDMMICNENWFDEYGYSSFFTELSNVFTEEELEKYSENLYYIDGAVMERYYKANNEMDYNYFEPFPASYDIEAMEKPIAVGFIIDDDNLIASDFAYTLETKDDQIIIGILSNSTNKELSHDLIVMLLNK